MTGLDPIRALNAGRCQWGYSNLGGEWPSDYLQDTHSAHIAIALHPRYPILSCSFPTPPTMAYPPLKHYWVDWICVAGLIALFFGVSERATPFSRQFYLNDMSLSHPFTHHERVLAFACIAIAFLVPFVSITGVSLYRAKGWNLKFIHQMGVGVLGLLLALSLNGNVTDALKCWIARPRPDFLDRCGAAKGTPRNVMVTVDVCTAPYGKSVLVEGMKLTPLGHSSIAFAGLGFLTLWLLGQAKLMQPNQRQPIYKFIVAFIPIAIATYIALLRTQDYRHHFGDVISGSVLGFIFAGLMYFRYYPALADEECDEPKRVDDIRPILPE